MVFISHKLEDKSKALGVQNYLKERNVDSWIDCLDPVLTQKKGNVTKHIVKELSKCTHIIAVFSTKTVKSHWVPFELGLAYNAGKNIATMKIEDVEHPQYLDEFPILKFTTNDLDKFIHLYRESMKMSKSLNERNISLGSVSGADAFIETLKRNLGQL